MKKEEIRKVVRDGYANIAGQSASSQTSRSCCSCGSTREIEIGRAIGYSDQELQKVPEGANLGLGCGNPLAFVSLTGGEVVLDLGSGAGFDCFLAAERVGSNGKVIGVDMTPEMIEKARYNALKSGYDNVEFRLGEIENLPVADNSVDLIISNCVINLSPDKEQVLKEAFRVLKPGGKIMISDIALLKQLPNAIRNSMEAYIGCISGAVLKNEYLNMVRNAGFQDVDVVDEKMMSDDAWVDYPLSESITDKFQITHGEIEEAKNSIISMRISGIKPGNTVC